ncbi:MAG: hypothetical protein JF606_24360 [Burkholderiales bacterium]|nr:hypothetical protein [Burkholderiales bacterium]
MRAIRATRCVGVMSQIFKILDLAYPKDVQRFGDVSRRRLSHGFGA